MTRTRHENESWATVGMTRGIVRTRRTTTDTPHARAAEIRADAFFLKSVASAAIVLVKSLERANATRDAPFCPEVSTARQHSVTTTHTGGLRKGASDILAILQRDGAHGIALTS
jgi:hypothetical protein